MIIVYRVAFAAAILGAWEFLSAPLDMEFFISTPSEIAAIWFETFWDGSLLFHAGITSLEAGLGFLLGGFMGMTLGLLLGRSQFMAELLGPFITAFYSLPKVALAPLFIVWFGIGLEMKVILTAAIVFFIVFLNTFTGVREVSADLVAILRLMGAKERHLLTKVIVPSAIVWVFAGLRLSVPYALIGAVVGEIIASNRGLGYLVAHAAGQFDTAGTFAALFSIVILALALNKMVVFAEKRLMPWRASSGAAEISI